MSPEQRVNLALDMSSTVTALVLDSIKDQHPGISRARLFELARKRLRSGSTTQQHADDVRAILTNTRVDTRKIFAQARKDGTINIFREILQSTRTHKSSNKRV